jgi:hypothetical protein
MVKFLQYF